MTIKDSYIQMRNSKKLNAEFLFSYYKDQGGTFPRQIFMGAVNAYDFGGLYDKLDSEFNLTLLFSSEGEFIKVVQ